MTPNRRSTDFSPEDRLWLAIIAKTDMTEEELRAGNFPEHIIEAWRKSRVANGTGAPERNDDPKRICGRFGPPTPDRKALQRCDFLHGHDGPCDFERCELDPTCVVPKGHTKEVPCASVYGTSVPPAAPEPQLTEPVGVPLRTDGTGVWRADTGLASHDLGGSLTHASEVAALHRSVRIAGEDTEWWMNEHTRLKAELAEIDSILGNRSAFDGLSRAEKVAKAVTFAAVSEKAIALLQAVDRDSNSRQLACFDEVAAFLDSVGAR